MDKKIYKLYYIPLVLLLGIFLASFYWLPTLVEMKYTNVISQIGGGSDFRDHFVCLNQLWNSPWGFGGSVPGCVDGISFRIGKVHLLVALLALALWWFVKKQSKENNIIFGFSLIGLLLSIFLTLSASLVIWNFITPMAFFQFPWRFLIIICLFSSFIAGSLPWIISKLFATKKYEQIFAVSLSTIIIVSTIFLYSKLFVPQSYIIKPAD